MSGDGEIHARLNANPSGAEQRGALLAIDYGTKRIGLAVCDPDRIIASPLGTTPNDFSMEGYFRELFQGSRFVAIVVGLPLHASGEESPMSEAARKFAAWVADLAKLPVMMWDERYTSHAAEGLLLDAKLSKQKRKARVDRVAAQMILQSFLEAGCPVDPANTLRPGAVPASPDKTSN